jgi:CheY-like chemotaxis protein
VRVESALGQGSTFTVTIPFGTAPLPADRIQAARAVAAAGATADVYVQEAQGWLPMPSVAVTAEPAADRELIVIADDNADMRKYLRHLLDGKYEVHTASDGRQALETTRVLRPALLLTDVMMPELDGFGLLRAVRKDASLASIPIILLSARAGEESRLEGLQAGADDYLVKPFTARELLARVEVHLKLAKLRRETGEREEHLRMEAELERQRLKASQQALLDAVR